MSKVGSPGFDLYPQPPSIKSLYSQTLYLLTYDLKYPHKHAPGVKLINRLLDLSLFLEPTHKHVRSQTSTTDFTKNISIVSKLNGSVLKTSMHITNFFMI